jgi:uncharacterized protein (DUF1778 family)
MPTSNKRLPVDYEPSEYEQIQAIAKAQGKSVTQFIRDAVRKEVKALGHIPSTYEYKSGQKKEKR